MSADLTKSQDPPGGAGSTAGEVDMWRIVGMMGGSNLNFLIRLVPNFNHCSCLEDDQAVRNCQSVSRCFCTFNNNNDKSEPLKASSCVVELAVSLGLWWNLIFEPPVVTRWHSEELPAAHNLSCFLPTSVGLFPHLVPSDFCSNRPCVNPVWEHNARWTYRAAARGLQQTL